MTTFFLSAVCAIAMNATAFSSPADTVDVYMIDGCRVEDFDGSQLKGKTISSYSVGRADGKAEWQHVIWTREYSVKIDGENDGIRVVAGSSVKPGIVILDGKEVEYEVLGSLDQKSILNVTVLKDEVAMQKYGDKAKDGVIVITTKDGGAKVPETGSSRSGQLSVSGIKGENVRVVWMEGNGTHEELDVVYVVDGKKVPKSRFDKLDQDKIKSITVIKDIKKVKEYTDNEKCAVICVWTK